VAALSRRIGSAILGGGAAGFGLLGVVRPRTVLRPRTLARMLGSDVETAREVGIRDLGNALVFAGGANRPAVLQRMLYDVSDAVVFGRRKPGVAAGALAFALLGALTLRAD
jgi:hypothetical protein